MKALIYLRISSDRTGLEAGVTRQREDCDLRCVERGWTVAAVYTDNDVSATGGRRRPGFEALLEAVEIGAVDVVVAWAVDRLQRSRRDEARLYEMCQRQGVLLSLVKGADLDFSTAAGRFVADSLGSVARMEVEMKSERQARAQRQAAEAGRRSGGRRPFGYESDGVTVSEPEARAVRDGFMSLLAGMPLGEIARQWNAQGFTTGQAAWKGERRGNPSPWRRDSVRGVFANPRYAGLRQYKGEIVADAVWPRIVEEETWRAAVAFLSNPERRTRPISGKGLLTGVAVCGVCGAHVHAGGGTTKGVRNYRCSGSMGHFSRRAEPIEEWVSAVVVARLARPDAYDLLVDEAKPDVEALRAEALALRGRLDSLAVDFADGALTASQVRTATARVRSKLADVEAEMADAGRKDLLGPLVRAEDVQATWDALGVGRQRSVIDALFKVTVHPAGRGTRTFRKESVGIVQK